MHAPHLPALTTLNVGPLDRPGFHCLPGLVQLEVPFSVRAPDDKLYCMAVCPALM